MSDATFTFRVDETLKMNLPLWQRPTTAQRHNFCATSCEIMCKASRAQQTTMLGFVPKSSSRELRLMPATLSQPPMLKPGSQPNEH